MVIAPGQQNHWDVLGAILASHQSAQLMTVHTRHFQVRDNQVGRLTQRRNQRLRSVDGLDHLEPAGLLQAGPIDVTLNGLNPLDHSGQLARTTEFPG